MWAHRKVIWGTLPSLPQGAQALLRTYLRDRRIQLPSQPDIAEGNIQGNVLGSRGSAAGSDGIPYKLYHWRVTFVAHNLHEIR